MTALHERRTIACHEAGHAAAMLAACGTFASMPSVPACEMGNRPWYAPAKLFNWTHDLQTREKIEAMRNMVAGPAIVAMAGPVAEARGTGRLLSTVLASPAGAADDAYLQAIGHRLYPHDFGQFRAEALRTAEEIICGMCWEAVESIAADLGAKGLTEGQALSKHLAGHLPVVA